MKQSRRYVPGCARAIACMAACLLGAGPVLAGATPPNNLESHCPAFAAWQRTHRHPMPGELKVIATEHVANPKLEVRLIDMSDAEQAAMAAFGGLPPSPAHKVRWAKLQSVQRHNLADIKAIIAEQGFPTITQVGTPGAWAMWDLVQHADSDRAFQDQALALMKPLVDDNEAPGEAYAYLVDRVRVAEGKRQLYGTQVHKVGNELVMRPVANPADLDARRARTGNSSEVAYLCYVSYRSGLKTRM